VTVRAAEHGAVHKAMQACLGAVRRDPAGFVFVLKGGRDKRAVVAAAEHWAVRRAMRACLGAVPDPAGFFVPLAAFVIRLARSLGACAVPGGGGTRAQRRPPACESPRTP